MGMDLDTGGGKKKAVRPVMNVAPLVDVVLVLLIIFMVITPLLNKQMTVNVPIKPEDNAAPPAPGQETQVVLWVGSDGKARINREVIPDDQLATRLRATFAARQDQRLFYDSHDSVPFGRTVQLIDLARGAGITQIAPLADPLAELE
jgi:biopolymer transport protein ExbD